MARKWTQAEDDYLRQHYPYVDNAQLARLLGVEHKNMVAHATSQLGLRKANPARSLAGLRTLVMSLASRPGGMRAADAGTEWGPHTVGRLCNVMAKRGELFPARMSFKHVLYFTDIEAAAAHQREHSQQPTVQFKREPGRAWWPKDAEPIITVTICPGVKPDPRTNTYAWGQG
jgi:hypothetical protein